MTNFQEEAEKVLRRFASYTDAVGDGTTRFLIPTRAGMLAASAAPDGWIFTRYESLAHARRLGFICGPSGKWNIWLNPSLEDMDYFMYKLALLLREITRP